MNYSAIFSNAHRQAKAMYATGFYATYRGAFSLALSVEMKSAWAEYKKDQPVKKQVKSIKPAVIANAAEKSIRIADFSTVTIFECDDVTISIQNTSKHDMCLNLIVDGELTRKYVSCLDTAKSAINNFADTRL